MTPSPNTYCTIEQFNDPDCWNTTSEICRDFESLLKRLNEIWSQHPSSEIGISVILRNQLQDKLQVGISKNGWLLILSNKNEKTRIFHCNKMGNDLTQFLLPELTDFESRYLVQEADAQQILRRWLDDGTFTQIN